MLDWNEYRGQLMNRIGEIAQTSPEIAKGYQAIAGAGKHTNFLDDKTRELISLAVAVTTHCDGCIAVHADAARKLGVSKEEIIEALGVAVAMNTGAAMVYSARVLDAFDDKK